jgi:hypothetical protein
MDLMSEREYAAHRKEMGLPGGSQSAVNRAIQSGRLTASVTKDAAGRTRIDPAKADREWAATTRSEYVPQTGPTSPAGASESTPELAESRARHEAAKAALAELELQEREGGLVSAAEVKAGMVGVFTRAKTKLLGIPSRARQQDPALTQAQLALLEGLIREALEDLAAEAEK